MGLLLATSAELVSAIRGSFSKEVVKIETLLDEHQQMVGILGNECDIEGLAGLSQIDFGCIGRFE